MGPVAEQHDLATADRARCCIAAWPRCCGVRCDPSGTSWPLTLEEDCVRGRRPAHRPALTRRGERFRALCWEYLTPQGHIVAAPRPVVAVVDAGRSPESGREAARFGPRSGPAGVARPTQEMPGRDRGRRGSGAGHSRNLGGGSVSWSAPRHRSGAAEPLLTGDLVVEEGLPHAIRGAVVGGLTVPASRVFSDRQSTHPTQGPRDRVVINAGSGSCAR